MFSKTVVQGSNKNAFYTELSKASGKSPQWNFHKYLIDRSGKRVASFSSETAPGDKALVAAVENAMSEKSGF
jgi:glutathione peroxidase